MALVNQAKREINSKIVFFGPGLAGKATNLKHIYNKLKPEFRGAIKAMNVQDARMLFFDFTPPGDGNVEGFRVRFHVYTVSGNLVDPAAWKMVLKGVDGVVFVADCQPQRLDANRESLETLTGYLKGYGQSLSSVPLVFQYNKTDLPDAQDISAMERELNPSRLPSFRASSQSGDGVLQTLLGLVKTVLGTLRNKGLEGIGSGESLQRMVEPAAAAAEPAAAVRPEVQQRQEAEPQAQPPQPAAPPVPPQAPSLAEAPFPPLSEAPAAEAPFAAQGVPQGGFGEVGGGEAGFGAAGAREAAGESLSLEVSGAPQPAGPGQFRLPLTIRSGSREKAVTLTISVSLEEE